jgi:hypothetical protein
MKAMAVVAMAGVCLCVVSAVPNRTTRNAGAQAQGSEQAVRPKAVKPSIDSIIVHPARGLPVVISGAVAGAGVQKRVPTSGKPISGDSIAKLREQLLKVASVSKRGLASVSNMLIVLDALEAPTPAEYHRRIAALPVTISESPTAGGSRRDVYVRGKLTLTVFVASNGGPTRDDAAVRYSEPTQLSEPGDTVTAATATPPAPSSAGLDYCEYTDDYGYWSGDCATQGDIDDLLATTAALDSDVEGLQSEADGALSQCQANYYPQNCLGSHELEFDIQGDLSVGGPSDAVAVSISLPCGEPSAGSGTGLRVATARFPCAQQAIEATAGFVGWLAAKAAAIYVANRPIAAAATTMSEVGWLTAGLIAGAFTFGFTVGNYINCLSGG